MKITGTQEIAPQYGMKTPQSDSFSKSLQKRIDSLKEQVQQLSENEEMDPKQKKEKKEELNRQISELQSQLSQRRAELQKKEEQPATEKPRNRDRFESSANSMNAAVSADLSTEQAKTRAGAIRSLQGKVNVLESEIKQDGSRGVSAEQKQASISKLRGRIENAAAKQGQELRKTAEDLKEAEEDAEKEERTEKTDERQEEKEDTEKRLEEKREADFPAARK